MKIRVLHIAPGLDYGGIASVILNYATRLDSARYEVDVLGILSEEAPRKAELEQHGGHYYYTGTFSNSHLVRHIWHWTKLMRQGHYDIVHAHCNMVSAWILLAARLAGCPIRIAHSHTTGIMRSNRIQKVYVWLRRVLLRRVATLCCACGQEAGEAMYGQSIPFRVIPNGIDFDSVQSTDEERLQLKQELQIDSQAHVYSLVARICEVKNHPFAVDVFYHIHLADPTAVLVLGGPGSEYDPTEQHSMVPQLVAEKIAQYQLQDSIRMVGARSDMASVYGITDCWLFPSLYEGFPTSLIELQAAGTPVLASDTITPSSDMGLGLVRYMSLNQSPQEWAEQAMLMATKTVIPQTLLRKEALVAHHLEIQNNAQEVDQLYCSLL